MAVADFSLPAWLNQDNTMLVPDAMAKGAAAGTAIAHAMQGAAQVRQAQQRLNMIKAEDQRQQAEFEQKAKMEAMRYQGFQNFARDREILKAQPGMTEELASQQALMKNLHLITAGDPRALATVMDRSADNERQSYSLGLQHDRLALAEKSAMEKIRLGGENLELRKKGLEDTERHRTEADKFKRDKEESDYKKDLEIQNLRSSAASKLEEQKQTGRVELADKKKEIADPIEEEKEAIDAEIAKNKIDLAKSPKKKLWDLGEDNRKIAIRNLEKQKAALGSVAPAKSKPGGAAPEIREDAQPDMVPIIAPDGRHGFIPRTNLEKALKAGYKEAE